MSEVNILYKKKWDYNLYQVDEKKVITVIFFDRIDYPRSFYLTKDESILKPEELYNLSELIRNNYEDFKDREIIPPIFQ